MNKRIQNEGFRGVRVCTSNNPQRGKYLTTSVSLSAHQFLGTYKGRICLPTSSHGRQHSSYRFLLTTIKTTRIFIDAKWNETDPAASLRFVNHSCRPTGRYELWNVLGFYRIVYFTNIDLQPHEELTADYHMVVYSPSDQVDCVCPVLPTHPFPRIDSKYVQRVLCPTNGDAKLIAHETQEVSAPVTEPANPCQSTPLNPLSQMDTLLTSQPDASSVRLAESGKAPPDVGS